MNGRISESVPVAILYYRSLLVAGRKGAKQVGGMGHWAATVRTMGWLAET